MHRTRIVSLGCSTILAIGLGASVLSAQSLSFELGKFEYMNSCAGCHGIDGNGKGPLADLLSVAPSDLTQLQKNNGGVFPVSQSFETIEGLIDIGAHGTREMPAWGQRYKERVAGEFDFGPSEIAQYPKMRILALIEYLSQIQQ